MEACDREAAVMDTPARIIELEIEPEAWARCERAQEAEQESLEALVDSWTAS